MEYQFEDLWSEDTNITWWKECRIELNKIIRIYNDWQLNGFSSDSTRKVLAHIELGKQTIGSRDGGSGYMEVLERMEQFVKSK